MRLKINLTTIISEVNLVVLTCDPEICNKYLFGLRYAVSVALKRQKKRNGWESRIRTSMFRLEHGN